MRQLLALKVGGQDIQLPAQIQPLQNVANNFGSKILSTVVSLLLLAAVILCLFYLILGGFKWIMSEGDAKQVEGARNQILWAAIGLGVCFLSFAFVNVLGYVLQIKLLGP
jgi:TRAP-type C4-dicarboxylate transport system permease small subunit